MESQAEWIVKAEELVKAAHRAEEKHLSLKSQKQHAKRGRRADTRSPTLKGTRSYLRRGACGGRVRLSRQVVISQSMSRLSSPIVNCSHGAGAANVP